MYTPIRIDYINIPPNSLANAGTAHKRLATIIVTTIFIIMPPFLAAVIYCSKAIWGLHFFLYIRRKSYTKSYK